jgi:hypothetical protein
MQGRIFPEAAGARRCASPPRISFRNSRVVQCRASIQRRNSMLELNLVYTRIKDMQGRLADLGRYL